MLYSVQTVKSGEPRREPIEVELKLALLAADSARLERQLARLPLLARRRATRQSLHNVYYDTPEQILCARQVALRLRRVGAAAQAQWLQTLKVGSSERSALSRRGEWESPAPGAALSAQALQGTPWSDLDPQGVVFRQLAPCFATSFERTTWLVRRRDGSAVEVALDLGSINAGERSAPICELELELKAGEPALLFEVARQIAASIAVLPLGISKSERGYAMARGAPEQALRARPSGLTRAMSPAQAGCSLLREMFGQFSVNLERLRHSDDPELLHQARIGWRRFRSTWRLFAPICPGAALPQWPMLQPLLSFMGELRDMAVALSEVLAPLAPAYTLQEAGREDKWQALQWALAGAAAVQRKAVRYALTEPSVGVALLEITEWLEDLPTGSGPPDARGSLRRWAARCITRLHRRLKLALAEPVTAQTQHRVRIVSKRLRYGIEALRPVLPARRSRRLYRRAVRLQTRIGASRDLAQTSALVARLEVDRELSEFLRGVAVGRAA